MADSPNEIIAQFLRDLPIHTFGNTAFRAVMILNPAVKFEPDTNWEDELFALIEPAGDELATDRRHSAAVLGAAALDYVYHPFASLPTSAEMHEVANRYQEEHGHESTHLRGIAERQDQVSDDIVAAREAWQQLRAGPLSLRALQESWWARAR